MNPSAAQCENLKSLELLQRSERIDVTSGEKRMFKFPRCGKILQFNAVRVTQVEDLKVL